MSQTLYVDFRDDGFWAYDVVASVFLRLLVEAAQKRAGGTEEHWLKASIKNWRWQVQVQDLGISLESDWRPEQIAVVKDIISEVVSNLEHRDSLPMAELNADGMYPINRGIDPIPAEPIRRFGSAVRHLLAGTLPKAPAGHWWFYAIEKSPGTIRELYGD